MKLFRICLYCKLRLGK